MKDVGILTFIRTLNFGAELQAYALEKSIESLGYSPELICYTNKMVSYRESVRPHGPQGMKYIKRFLGELIKWPEKHQRREGFDGFEDRFISIGDPVRNAEDIILRYQRVVVGSDQVWAPGIVGDDMTYFLTEKVDANQRLISYAASFGDKVIPDSRESAYRESIRVFDSVSVRESSGIDTLNKLGRGDGVVVLDPTLLLDAGDWALVASQIDLPDRYVFAYAVSERKATFEYALKLAQENGMRLLYIDAYGVRPIRGGKNVGGCSPSDFITYIMNASFIVTSSFHGLCFSVIFNKQMKYFADYRVDKSSRLDNLAISFGLENCNLLRDRRTEDIDYGLANRRIARMRAASIGYLRDALD